MAFSGIHLTANGRELISVWQASFALIPACCVASYLALATRKFFATVVFTIGLVACMKLLGGIVVVLIHGWDASEHGYTTMPWAPPNLLVWLFWFNTGVLSLTCY